MANNSTTVVVGTQWVKIGDDTNSWYLQNEGSTIVYLKMSDTTPTDRSGSVEIQPNQNMNSGIMSGNVWASVIDGSARCAIVTGITIGGGSGGGSGTTAVDRELVVTTYTCKTAFTGASIGDTITQTQVIDVTSTPSTVSVVWRNQSTATDLASAPSSANLTLAGVGIGLTDAQLRAAPIMVSGTVEVTNDVGNPLPVSGSVSVAGSVSHAGDMVQIIPDTTPATFLTYYDVSMTGGDALIVKPTSNGQLVTAISMSPLSDNHESAIYLKNLPYATTIPHVFGLEASISQRPRGQFAVMEIVNSSSLGVAPTVEQYTIATIQQATTTITITFATAVNTGGAGGTGLNIGDWIDVSGVTSDNRLNYSNLCINSISADGKTITCTYADDTAITSISSGPYSQGVVTYRPQLGSATAGYGMRFSGTSATACAYVSKFGGYETQMSGTLNTAQTATSASTAPVFSLQANGHYDVKATSKFWVKAEPQSVFFYDVAVDSTATASNRVYRSGVKPDFGGTYGVRFRAVTPKSISRPIARILSASKTGTTTTTINTDVAHGLVTGQYVTIKGILDQTNFANITTPVQVTVTSTTQFTVVLGTAVTATSYGGSVILTNNSGIDQPGIVTQVVQSVARDANGIYTFIGNGTWATPAAVGEYVNIHGLVSSTGVDLGLDGVYEIMNLSTTTMLAKPVADYTGTYLAPNSTTPITTTSCGGTVILRTTLRSHDIIGYTYKQNMVQIDGQGTSDLTKAVPTYSVGGSLTVSQGTAASLQTTATQGTAATISATTGLGGWYTHPAITGIVDVASAAITTTTTTASIANNLGNAFEVVVVNTAMSGTTPTLDVRIEESFDGGTNWHTLYEFERISAAAQVAKSPMLRANGRHIRYVQTVGGTTPSFTRAITRNVFPSSTADKIARLYDRAISLTTLSATTASLFAGSASNVQLVVNLGAATTAPVFKLQGSEDNTNWYDLSATTLTSVASSTVQLTLNNINAPYVRGIVSTAGATVTAGYVLLKAWS